MAKSESLEVKVRADLTDALTDGFAKLGLAVDLLDIFGAATAEVLRARELHGDQTHLPLGIGPDRRILDDLSQFFTSMNYWEVNNTELADSARRLCQDAASTQEGDTWGKICLEEFFEMFAEDDPDKVETEAIQVMAMLANLVIAARKAKAAAA